MAKIIVTSDQSGQSSTPVFLEESVYPVHLSSEHAARQLIERLSWALNDAEAAERREVARVAGRRARATAFGAGSAKAA
jgi:hypothetical protein